MLHTASTNPQLRYVPTTCDQPVCNNDPLLCPDYMVCTDIELPVVLTVESFTTYYFTAEYGLRLLTVWAVTPRVAGVIPAAWEAEHVYNPHAPQPHYSPWYQSVKFVFRFKNLVDLAAILPFYLQYFTTNLPPTNFIRALRLLRLIRVLRLLKLLSFLKNVDVMIDLMLATLSQASLLLNVFLFAVMIVVIIFGCLVYIAEQGVFTVINNLSFPLPFPLSLP